MEENNILKEEMKKKERKSLNNIYEYFSEYTKEEIDLMLESLPLSLDEEKRRVL